MKTLFALLLGIVSFTLLPCEAKSHLKNADKVQKIYVDPQAVKVTKDGIFLLEQGNLIAVKKVAKDRNGIFIEKRLYRPCPRDGAVYDWDKFNCCPWCKYPN